VLLFLLLAVATIPILSRLGVFRASNIVGPFRLKPGESIIELLVLLVVAFFLIFCVSTLYVLVFHPTNPLMDSAVIDGAGAAILLGLNIKFRGRESLARLGLTAANARRAMGLSPAIFLLIVPSVYLLSIAIGLTLQHFQKEIPMHPFLKLIQESHDPKMIALLFFSAAVIAPVAEELLFRAHIQTILGRLFMGFSRRAPVDASLSVAVAEPVASEPGGAPVLNYATPIVVDQLPRTTRARWWAVIVTSILFALVHQQLAFLPPLFVLAMGLGYTYERTGNLWACIGIHGLFNATQVAMFLLSR